jgi:hypothetical protein
MVALLIAIATVQWVQIADYQPNNSYVDLEIAKVEAKYVPFFHDDNKPNECLPARIMFTFTVENHGKRPVKLPKFIAYEINTPKPWMRNTEPMDLMAHPEQDVVFGEHLMLRPEDRKTLKPQEKTTIQTWRTPPGGPWHPMKLEARFAEQLGGDLVWVGPRQPHRAVLSSSVPDYRPVSTLSKPEDGKPEKESALFSILAQFECSGPAVGGPVEMFVSVPTAGKKSPAITAGETQDDDSALRFLKEKIPVRGPADFDAVTASIKVGCPKHKFQYRLIDGNPSNDTRILKRGKSEGLFGDGGTQRSR